MRLVREYLLGEVMAVFGLSLFIITSIFMSQRIIQLAEWAVNRGVGLMDMGMLMIYLLPSVLLIVVPIVTLFSIIIAVGRWSSDNEVTALKSAGVSLYRLFPSVLLFAFFTSSLSMLSSQVLSPEAAFATRKLQYKIVRTRTEAAVEERTFIELIPQTFFYVRERRGRELLGVMAAREEWPGHSSWRSRLVVFAEKARFVHDPSRLENELWLLNGTMVREDREEGREEFVEFETCRMRLDLGEEPGRKGKKREELDLTGMMSEISKKKEMSESKLKIIIQLHERFSWPLSCLALCFWAVPLGIQPPRAGRARSIIVAVILSAAFYYMMIFARFMSLQGWLAPGVSIWLPDLLILASGFYMLRQKNRERPIMVLSVLEDNVYYLLERLKQRREKGGQV